MRSSSSGGSSYNDSWIKEKLKILEAEINAVKKLDSYMAVQKDKNWSYDPQLPYYLHRENERFQYMMIDIIVTDKGAESTLNSMGDSGWMIAGMGIVAEKTGSAPFMFKLNLVGEYGVNPTKFAYKCFQYEIASSYLLEEKLNKLNGEGFDFTSTSAFNKTHSFCLLTNVIY